MIQIDLLHHVWMHTHAFNVFHDYHRVCIKLPWFGNIRYSCMGGGR